MFLSVHCSLLPSLPFEILIELLLILPLRNKYDSDDMTSTCIFADTLVRDHSEKCHEYYESIILEFPVSMAGLSLVFEMVLRAQLKWGASSRWPFGQEFRTGQIIGKTPPTLVYHYD